MLDNYKMDIDEFYDKALQGRISNFGEKSLAELEIVLDEQGVI